MDDYKKRIADNLLVRKLEGKGAVLLQGPKWCGKTTTAEQFAASTLYMADPRNRHFKDERAGFYGHCHSCGQLCLPPS